MRRTALIAAAAVAVSSTAFGAAWPAQKNELVINQTTLLDFYEEYARNSTNRTLLEEPRGSVVQAGTVRRQGILLGAEYGISESFTLTVNFAYFFTQHLRVGDNLARFTNSQPNRQNGFQDLTGNLKFTAFMYSGNAVRFAVAPYVGWQIPLQRYDTSLNNPLGDGIITLEPSLALSLMVPGGRFYVNGDGIYKIRSFNAPARVGAVYPASIKLAIPDYPDELIGGKIHDQIQGTIEAGYLVTDWLALRGMARGIMSLGGENLTFEGMSLTLARGFPPTSMFDNSLAYKQDAVFVGGGIYVQLGKYFGIAATYVHAVWYRNFPNMKTALITLSFNPQLAARAAEAELKALQEAADAAEAAEAEEEAPAPAPASAPAATPEGTLPDAPQSKEGPK